MSDSFSETDLLKKIFPLIDDQPEVIVPPGDDCAVFKAGGQNLAVTVDQVIESRHYLPETPAALVGKKLMARNISDIAAMGGTPRFAVLSSASSSKEETWLLEFHKGLIEEGQKFGVTLIGGDLASTRLDTVNSLTLFGEVKKTGVLRSGARPKHNVFVTGTLGASFESEHHLNFNPRLKEGQFLQTYAAAMIDITDGLLIDLKRICKASGISAVIDLKSLPLRDSEGNSIQKALTDGEDYELLFAVDEEKSESLQNDWPFSTKLTMIGSFSDLGEGVILSESGENLVDEYGEGFDHFK